jgi:hypothetical protein
VAGKRDPLVGRWKMNDRDQNVRLILEDLMRIQSSIDALPSGLQGDDARRFIVLEQRRRSLVHALSDLLNDGKH